MDPLSWFLIIILTILTTLLVVVGIQVFYLVKEARGTLKKYNRILGKADKIATHVSDSIDEAGDTVNGLRSGLKLVEAFAHWVQKNQHSHELLP